MAVDDDEERTERLGNVATSFISASGGRTQNRKSYGCLIGRVYP